MTLGDQLFSTGQGAHQFFGVMDQDGEVLWTDPVLVALVRNGQQGDFFAGFPTNQAVFLKKVHIVSFHSLNSFHHMILTGLAGITQLMC
jgi:hypothetical protein